MSFDTLTDAGGDSPIMSDDLLPTVGSSTKGGDMVDLHTLAGEAITTVERQQSGARYEAISSDIVEVRSMMITVITGVQGDIKALLRRAFQWLLRTHGNTDSARDGLLNERQS